jgi:hypothetical protein
VTTIPATHLGRFATLLSLGAGTGAVFLGVGGRLVMHAFALATARSGSFTLGGSLNVVLAGAIAGAIGGLLFAMIERFMPKRVWLRGVLFAGTCYVIATPGFRPPQPLVFGLFAPAFLGYGVALALAWERVTRSRRLTSA